MRARGPQSASGRRGKKRSPTRPRGGATATAGTEEARRGWRAAVVSRAAAYALECVRVRGRPCAWASVRGNGRCARAWAWSRAVILRYVVAWAVVASTSPRRAKSASVLRRSCAVPLARRARGAGNGRSWPRQCVLVASCARVCALACSWSSAGLALIVRLRARGRRVLCACTCGAACVCLGCACCAPGVGMVCAWRGQDLLLAWACGATDGNVTVMLR